MFDPAPEHVRTRSLTDPLCYSPALAKAFSLLSAAVIFRIMAWALRGDANGERQDLTFALTMTAMLLVSLICWGHYLLLLLVPLAVVWITFRALRFRANPVSGDRGFGGWCAR